MGGSQSRRDESFKAGDWEQVHDTDLIKEAEGQYSVVRNRMNGQLLDRYLLQFPNEHEYNKYMESVSYRRSQPNIVRIIHYEPKIVKQFCGSAYLLNVYLEHCRSRLSEYEDIPFPDYLYCAMAMLDGYKKLYNKIGRFYVSQQQVMIDDEGEVRVWLNTDFSENQAEDLRTTSNNYNGSNEQQFEMVDDIMKIIFQNSDEAEGPRLKLVDYYERQKNNYNHRVGFEQAKNIILDYSKMNNIQIPDIFKSVYDIYQSDQGRVPDTTAFKNQLLNNSMHSEQDHLHKVGAPVRSAYDPVQSVIQPNQSQLSGNFSSNTAAFVRQGSHSNIPHLVSTMPAPNAINSIAHVNRFPVASQHSFAPPINSSFQSRTINHLPPQQQQFRTQTAPLQPFQGHIIRQPQFMGHSSAPTPQGFPITIKPPNAASNLSVGRTPGPLPSFQPQPHHHPQPQPQPIINHVTRPIQGSQPIISTGSRGPLNLMPASIPVGANQTQNNQITILNLDLNKRQIVKKADSLPQDLSHEVMGGLYVGRDKAKKVKAELGEQELEIEKNIILKGGNQSASGEHQYINQANIIRDLSQLHKIQQQQKSKRSAIQEESQRNNSPDKNGEDDDKEYGYDEEYEKDNTSREMLAPRGIINNAKIDNNQHLYEFEEGDQQHLFRQESQDFDNGRKIQTYQPSSNQNTAYRSQPVYGQQGSYNNQSSPRFVQQSPSLPQQGQSQHFSGFNPHMNNQGQRPQPQAPPVLHQFNSIQFSQTTGTGYNQSTYQTANIHNIANNQINSMTDNVNRANSLSKKQFYYTLSNQIQLDPQIAADMALYFKS